MSDKTHIMNLISMYTRRLQQLEEKHALTGVSTPPETLIEIEDIKRKISELRTELEADDFRYGVKIDSPEDGAKVGTPVKVFGGYTKKPPERSLRLFTVSTDDGWYWPQNIVHLGPNKTWHSEVSLRGTPPYQMNIVVALVGEGSQALWEYYYKVGKQTDYTPIDGPLPSDVFECDRVLVERV